MIRFATPATERDLCGLSQAFVLWVDEDYQFVIVCGLNLPTGYDRPQTDLLIELPADYPMSPPGVGENRVYLPPGLRFHRRKLKDLHTRLQPEFETPGFGPWAWFCYEYVEWYPDRDNLIKFVEMVRADLTNPPTRRGFLI